MTRPSPAWLADEHGETSDGAGVAGPAGPSDETRRLAWERADGHCESCGELADPEDSALHHRRPKGMGGSRLEIVHSIENLALVCGRTARTGCHRLIHLNPIRARDTGWTLHPAATPARVPIRLYDGRDVLLGADGTYHDSATVPGGQR